MAFQSFLVQLACPEILVSVFCFIFLYYFYQYKKSSWIPVNWPFIGMLGAIVDIQNFYNIATGVLRETGCTFLFKGPWFCGMNILFTCDPANLQHIFNVNFSNYPKGEEYAEIFDILGDGIFNADEDSWKKQRFKAHKLVNDRKFRDFVAQFSLNKVKCGLVPLLNKVAEQGMVVDLQDVFLRLTFDTTSCLVFGVDPCSLSLDFPTMPFASAMDDAMNALFLRHCVPKALWKLFRWLRIGAEKRYADGWKVIDKFIAEKIAEKKKQAFQSNTDHIYEASLISAYIDDHEPENSSSKELDKLLRDTTISFMLAGRDTTGVALTWFFWLLTQNPHVEAKILQELKDNFVLDDIPTTESGNKVEFDSEKLSKLVYMHAALCEALRLFPPVPLEHKGVVQHDVLPSGHKVQPGLEILVPIYCMARMEGIWGKDCLEFRPERWITESGRVKHEPSYRFMSFNSGPRTCLGKEVAFTQIKAVVAAMVYNFQVEVVEGHVVEPKLSIILHMRNGLKVKIKRRTSY